MKEAASKGREFLKTIEEIDKEALDLALCDTNAPSSRYGRQPKS